MQETTAASSGEARPQIGYTSSPNHNESISSISLPAQEDRRRVSSDNSFSERSTTAVLSDQHSNISAEYKPVATEDNATPQVSHRRRRVELSAIATDCVAILLSLAMVVFVIIVWKLDGSKVTEIPYDSWKNAITILATGFPIFFASIVGRLMAEAARWNLEKGSTVGCLEQLMGSQTVGGAALTVLRLRYASLLTPILLLLWSFSPLGAQSLLRMTELQSGSQSKDTSVTFFDSSAKSQVPDWFRDTRGTVSRLGAISRQAALKSLYTTLVTAPENIKNSTMDIWGNVKIPILVDLEDNEWHNTSTNSSIVQYNSLAGVPVRYIYEGDSNISFPLESSYVHVDCVSAEYFPFRKSFVVSNVSKVEEGGLYNASDYAIPSSRTNGTYHLPNGTYHGFNRSGSGWTLALDRFVDPVWLANNNTKSSAVFQSLRSDRSDNMDRPILFVDENGVDAGPTSLLFEASCQKSYTGAEGYFRSYCGVKQRYVESVVNCSAIASKRQCAVTAQRLSEKPHPPEDISQLSFPGVFWSLSEGLPSENTITYQSESSLYYIKDPSLKTQSSEDEHFLANVTKDDVSVRLTQLINTYLQLSQLYLNMTTGAEADASFQPNITVPGRTEWSFVVVHISKTWAILCLMSGICLLGASILGAVFKHRAHGPEALGYVSTVFRDSRYMEPMSDSGWIDGNDLSRRMRNERIRLGIVGFEDEKKPVLGVAREEDTGKI